MDVNTKLGRGVLYPLTFLFKFKRHGHIFLRSATPLIRTQTTRTYGLYTRKLSQLIDQALEYPKKKKSIRKTTKIHQIKQSIFGDLFNSHCTFFFQIIFLLKER